MAKSKGRMIRCDIGRSHKIASLAPEALALFTLLIPHFNSFGKMNGDVNYIKGEVCPLVPWLTPKKIKNCLLEITCKTNVKWFEHEGLMYLHSLHWAEHQELRSDRLGIDELPTFHGQDLSGTIPGVVPLEEGSKGKEQEGNKKEIVSAQSFIELLKGNPAYQSIDFDKELGKMQAWILAHPGRKLTKRFAVNWLNKTADRSQDVFEERDSDQTKTRRFVDGRTVLENRGTQDAEAN